jgi:ABC-type phosphate transport system auxiliary subunit
MELEKRLTKVENELKSMKKEAKKKELVTKKEEAKSQETIKDMMARWMKDDGGQGCSNDAMKM